MIPTISVHSDVERLIGWARGVAADQVAFAVSLALNLTARDAKAELEREIDRRFDRPTQYTRRALRVFPSTKQRLVARVHWREDARHYLDPQVEGGTRRGKAFETALRAAGVLPAGWYVVPGQGANIDAAGNMDRGQIVQMLSQLRITLTAGYGRNMSFDARKQIAAQRRAGGRFFVVPVGNPRGQQPGVYQREFAGRNATPVAIFVASVEYRERYPVLAITRAVVRSRFEPNFRQAFARALATARR